MMKEKCALILNSARIFVRQAALSEAKTKKWRILLAACIICCVLFYFLFPKFHPDKPSLPRHLSTRYAYFVPVKITEFSSANIPYITLNVKNKSITAKIDLGTDMGFALPLKFLKDLNSKSLSQVRYTLGIRGKKYINNVYKLPQVDIGDMVFRCGEVEEINAEYERDACLISPKDESLIDSLGVVGWKTFYNVNILLDCEHSTIAFCDSLETLKKQGYPVESFTEAPLLLDRGFIEFDAMTEAGPLRCRLDTGATWNCLNKDLETQCNDHMIFKETNHDQYPILNPENKDLLVFDPQDIYKTSSFVIGGKEFGPLTFTRIKTPMEFDAIIGMEFIDLTLIFVDFFHRKIYFFDYT